MRLGFVSVGGMRVAVAAFGLDDARERGMREGWTLPWISPIPNPLDAVRQERLIKFRKAFLDAEATKVYAPWIKKFSPRIVQESSPWEHIYLGGGVILHRGQNLSASGMFLEPGHAIAINTGDPIVIAIHGGHMVVAQGHSNVGVSITNAFQNRGIPTTDIRMYSLAEISSIRKRGSYPDHDDRFNMVVIRRC